MDLSIYNVSNIFTQRKNSFLFSEVSPVLSLEDRQKEKLEGLVKLFPKKSSNILQENLYVVKMIGMCVGFNIAYQFSNLSDNDKRIVMLHNNLDPSTPDAHKFKNVSLDIYDDIAKNISEMPECSMENITNIYTKSIQKYLHDYMHNFIFPNELIERHFNLIKDIKKISKSNVIANIKLNNGRDIKLYLSDDITEYYLSIKYDTLSLINIHVDDHSVEIFALFLGNNINYIKEYLTNKWTNLLNTINDKYKNITIDDDIKKMEKHINNINNINNESIVDIRDIMFNIVDKIWVSKSAVY